MTTENTDEYLANPFTRLGPIENIEFPARELADWRAEGFRTPQFARR